MAALGSLIAIEGIDGVGKTRLIELFKKRFQSDVNFNMMFGREPYDYENIQDLIWDKSLSPYSVASIINTNRLRHQKDKIIPQLKSGFDYMVDRWIFSTLAYQQAQGAQLHTLMRMCDDILVPDLTVLLSGNLATCLRRANEVDSVEKELILQSAYQTYRNYLPMIYYTKRLLVINTEKWEITEGDRVEQIYEMISIARHVGSGEIIRYKDYLNFNLGSKFSQLYHINLPDFDYYCYNINDPLLLHFVGQAGLGDTKNPELIEARIQAHVEVIDLINEDYISSSSIRPLSRLFGASRE